MMNKNLRTFFDSFKFNRNHWFSFAVDVVAVLVITFLFLGLGNILAAKAYAISNGKTADQLKIDLLTATLEESKDFLANVKGFAFYFFAGTIFAVLASLFIFSFSRMVIWSRVLQQKISKKRYWRWNLVVLTTGLLLIPYLLVYFLLRLILDALICLISNGIILVVYVQAIKALFILAFILFAFLVSYSFVQNYKVWLSVGNAFHLLKEKWKDLWKAFLFAVVTSVVISFFLMYAQKFLFLQPIWLGVSVNLGVFLLFLTWMRLYVLRTIQ